MTRKERDQLYYDRKPHNKKCKPPKACNCCLWHWVEEAAWQDIDEGIRPPMFPEEFLEGVE